MAADDKIQMWNPNTGRPDVKIDREKFDAVRKAILKALPRKGSTMPFKELPLATELNLPDGQIPGGGSVMWYVTTVKLHMEHEGERERVAGETPQVVRRVK